MTNYFLRGLAAIENKPRSWTNNTYFSHFENSLKDKNSSHAYGMKIKKWFQHFSADFHTFHLFFFRSTIIMHIGSNFFPTKIVKLQFASSKPSGFLEVFLEILALKNLRKIISDDNIWILNDALFRKKHHHLQLLQLKDSFFFRIKILSVTVKMIPWGQCQIGSNFWLF